MFNYISVSVTTWEIGENQGYHAIRYSQRSTIKRMKLMHSWINTKDKQKCPTVERFLNLWKRVCKRA